MCVPTVGPRPLPKVVTAVTVVRKSPQRTVTETPPRDGQCDGVTLVTMICRAVLLLKARAILLSQDTGKPLEAEEQDSKEG